ncbi:hypothetical protein EYC59_04335 [Candidatus Saccharibacteria bacterium]|nr:MAG: hypothetical protein EYC59_04335 [Candidatus Saccharibacteria bacterium]
MLANRYSVQTVLLDANNAVYELPTATEMRNAHLRYWEFEISGRAAALRDAALGRVDSLSEIESPRGIDNEADDASNELLYNGIRILGVAARLPQPVSMHFETISSPHSKVMQALSAMTISTEFAVPNSEVLAQMPPLDA